MYGIFIYILAEMYGKLVGKYNLPIQNQPFMDLLNLPGSHLIFTPKKGGKKHLHQFLIFYADV